MTHGTEQHLEHAEHVQHAAHNPFDKRVAMSMSIIAAVLAAASMLSHRSHNRVLQLQGEAIRLKSESTSLHTQASDLWNYYQAKKQRMYLYGAQADLVRALGNSFGEVTQSIRAVKKAVGELKMARAEGQDRFEVSAPDKADKKTEGVKAKAKAAKKSKAVKKATKAPTEPEPLAAWWKSLAGHYKDEAADLEKRAKDLVEQAHDKEKEAEHELKESEHVHHQADRLDFGDLGLQLGLVLCSIAVLTKQKGFWFSGMGVAVFGACVSLTAYLL